MAQWDKWAALVTPDSSHRAFRATVSLALRVGSRFWLARTVVSDVPLELLAQCRVRQAPTCAFIVLWVRLVQRRAWLVVMLALSTFGVPLVPLNARVRRATLCHQILHQRAPVAMRAALQRCLVRRPEASVANVQRGRTALRSVNHRVHPAPPTLSAPSVIEVVLVTQATRARHSVQRDAKFVNLVSTNRKMAPGCALRVARERSAAFTARPPTVCAQRVPPAATARRRVSQNV